MRMTFKWPNFVKAYYCKLISLFLFLFSLRSFADLPACTTQFTDSLKYVISTCKSPACNSLYSETLFLRAGPSYNGVPQIQCVLLDCPTGGTAVLVEHPATCGNNNFTPILSSNTYTNSNSCQGSIIQVSNGVLGETIPITGTNFSLNYFSNRVIGRKGNYNIRIPLTGADIWDGFGDFNIKINNEAQRNLANINFQNIPNQGYEYLWNGKNDAGQETYGSVIYEILIRPRYTTAVDVQQGTFVFNRPVVVGSFKAKKIGLGGWVPSVYHFYDHASKTIYRGDGSTRSATGKLLTNGNWQIAEEDGHLVYEFLQDGRHFTTRTGVTGSIIYTFNYVAAGLSSIVEPFSKTTTFNRNGNGKLISITSPYSKVTTATINTNGYLATVTDPNNKTHTMTYVGAGGLLNTFQTPVGKISTFTYNTMGDLLTDSNNAGQLSTLTSVPEFTGSHIQLTSKLGRVFNDRSYVNTDGSTYKTFVNEKTSADGVYVNSQTNEPLVGGDYFSTYVGGSIDISKSYLIDPRFGTQVKRPSLINENTNGTTRTTNISETLNLTNPSDIFSIGTWTNTEVVGNSQIITTYNGSTKTYTSQTVLGRTKVLKTDTLERPTEIKQGNLNSILITYTNDKITQVAQGARSTTFAYNTAGLLQSSTNALNQTTQYAYNNLDRLTTQTFPNGRVITYNYDAMGKVTSITPPSRPAHLFTFHLNEMLDNYKAPLLAPQNNETKYIYNDDRDLVQILRPNGDVINFDYDLVRGVLTQINTSEGVYSTDVSSIHGYLNSISAPNGWNHYFNYVGRTLTNEIATNGVYNYSFQKNFQTATSLLANDVFEFNGATYQINYTYDNDEYLKQAGSLGLTYNVPNGQLTGTTISTGSNSANDTYTYNTFGEVLSYTGKQNTTTVFSETLTYDNLGRIATKTIILNGYTTYTYTYTYDNSGRVIQTTRNGTTIATYSYDNNSNRNGGTINGVATTATYDNQDRMLTYNSNTYQYNANGERTSKTISGQTTSYVHNVFGELTQVTLPNGNVIDYDVDALGRRTAKKLNGVIQKQYLYRDDLRIQAELNPNGTLKRRYIYASKSNIPDYFLEGSEKYRIYSDHLGSPRIVVRLSNNTIVAKMDHDEFGRVIVDTNPGYLPFGFAGGIYDPSTSLVKFGKRTYDPETGRWLSKDSILFNGGDTNLYGYVTNDPVNFIDPTGNFGIALVPFLPAIVEGVVFIGTAIGAGWSISEIINYYNEKRPYPKGPPNGSVKLPNGDERIYDNNGNPIKDIDWGHNRGHGVPHVHDWIPDPNGELVRGPGRPPKPGECK